MIARVLEGFDMGPALREADRIHLLAEATKAVSDPPRSFAVDGARGVLLRGSDHRKDGMALGY